MLLNHNQEQSELIEYIQMLDSILREQNKSPNQSLSAMCINSLNITKPTNDEDTYGSQRISHERQLESYCLEPLLDVNVEEQAKKFEHFLEEQRTRQNLEDKWKLQSKSTGFKNRRKRPMYIQKHQGPEHNFFYHGIKLGVKFRGFQKQSGTIMAVPYSGSAKELSDRLQNDGLSLYVLKKLDKEIPEVGTLSCYYANKFYPNRNYKWIYLYKKPKESCLREQSEYFLDKFIKKCLQTAIKHKCESMIIPFFEWPALSQKKICTRVFASLMGFLSTKLRQQRVALKQIVFCGESSSSYFSLSGELKEISDEYIRCGAVNP